jgi:hypothetical protein
MSESLFSLDSKEPEQGEEATGSYERWQKTMMQQQGAVINLILTLTIAAMGFGVSLMFKKESEVIALSREARWVVLGSLAVFLIAVFWGLQVNLTRLWDFRWTARAARLRELRERYEPEFHSTSRGPMREGFPRLASWVHDLEEPRTDSEGRFWVWFFQGPRDNDRQHAEVLKSIEQDIEALRSQKKQERERELSKQLEETTRRLEQVKEKRPLPESQPAAFEQRLQAEEQERQAEEQQRNAEQQSLQNKVANALGILHDRCSANATRMGKLTSRAFALQLLTFLAGVSVLAVGMLVQTVEAGADQNKKATSEKEQAESLSSIERQLDDIKKQLTDLGKNYETLLQRTQNIAAPRSSPANTKKKPGKYRR